MLILKRKSFGNCFGNYLLQSIMMAKKSWLIHPPGWSTQEKELRIRFYTLSVENDKKSVHVSTKKECMAHISEKLRVDLVSRTAEYRTRILQSFAFLSTYPLPPLLFEILTSCFAMVNNFFCAAGKGGGKQLKFIMSPQLGIPKDGWPFHCGLASQGAPCSRPWDCFSHGQVAQAIILPRIFKLGSSGKSIPLIF